MDGCKRKLHMHWHATCLLFSDNSFIIILLHFFIINCIITAGMFTLITIDCKPTRTHKHLQNWIVILACHQCSIDCDSSHVVHGKKYAELGTYRPLGTLQNDYKRKYNVSLFVSRLCQTRNFFKLVKRSVSSSFWPAIDICTSPNPKIKQQTEQQLKTFLWKVRKSQIESFEKTAVKVFNLHLKHWIKQNVDMQNYPLGACSMLDFLRVCWRSRKRVPLCN